MSELDEIAHLKSEVARLEKKLADRELIFDNILESTLAGYWDWKMDQEEEFLSPNFKKMLGYQDHEMANRPESWQRLMHPEDLREVKASFDKHVQTRGEFPHQGQARYTHKSGKTIWIYYSGKVVEWGDNGEPLRLVGCHVDISELKEAQQLAKFADQLEAKNKELEEFAYVASHDLQEPLRTITSFAKLIDQHNAQLLDDKGKQYLSGISTAAGRMTTLIQSLLEYSRIGVTAQKQTIACTPLVEAIVNDLAFRIKDSGASINLNHLPTVQGYESELRMLFQNLISNAVKFQKPGVSPRVDISAEDSESYWKFEVKDNGIGIKMKFHERIFKIFQRLHTRTEFEGTGIGLAHCKKIVELHGGKIWVESEPDQGSTFHFTLPK